MQLIPVILCNKAEAKPRPTSRELHSDDYSLLQKSIFRGAMLSGVQKLIAVTPRDIFCKTKEEQNEINFINQTISFILEPFQRNTAAAVTAAASHIAQFHSEDALILVLPTDHLNVTPEAFQHTISFATESALSGKLVTFGMVSYETNTKYSPPTANNNNALQDETEASFQSVKEPFVSQFLWNSNLFLFKAGAILQAIREHCPDVLSTTLTCLKNSKLIEENSSLRLALDPSSFCSIPKYSINDAVIKKSNKTVVVPCDLNWLNTHCL